MKNKQSKKTLTKFIVQLGLIGICAGTIGIGSYAWIRREWTPKIEGEQIKITAGTSLMFVLNNTSTDSASLVSLLGSAYQDFVLKPVSNLTGAGGEFYNVSYTSGVEDAVFKHLLESSTAAAADAGYIEFEFSLRVTSAEYDQYVFLNPASKLESSSLGASQAMRCAIAYGNDSGKETIHLFRNQNRVVKAEGDYTEEDVGKLQYYYMNDDEKVITLDPTRSVGSNVVDNSPYLLHQGITPIQAEDGFGGTYIDDPDGQSYIDTFTGEPTNRYTRDSKAELFSSCFGGIYKIDDEIKMETVSIGQDKVETRYYVPIPSTVGDGTGSSYDNIFIKDKNGELVIFGKATEEEQSTYADYYYAQSTSGMIIKRMDENYYTMSEGTSGPIFTPTAEGVKGNFVRCDTAYYVSSDGHYYVKDESVKKADDDLCLFIAPKNATTTVTVYCRIWLEGCDPNCLASIKDKLVDVMLVFDMFENRSV